MKGKALVLATAMDENGTTSALMQGRGKLGETTETGLILYEPFKLSYEEYEEIGRLLGNANRRMQWVIGDWLVLVEDIFPDRYSQAVHATGLSPGTLANRASVARRYPDPKQRVAGVPFSVHADVAYMEPRERTKWLKRAKDKDWTRAELREHLHHEREPDSVGDLAVSSTAGSGDRLLGELELSPVPITCPACGHEFSERES